MTQEHVEWEPEDKGFEERESRMMDHNMNLKDCYDQRSVAVASTRTNEEQPDIDLNNLQGGFGAILTQMKNVYVSAFT